VTPRPAGSGRWQVVSARSREDVEHVRALFLEYAAGLGVDLEFQGFEEEVRALPGEYAPPGGTLLLARRGPEVVGCAGVRPLPPGDCELKRLYVRPAARGLGLGRRLLARALAFAEAAGYGRMWLDTLPTMAEAIGLYGAFGFVEVAPYRPNPIPGARYFRRELGRGTSK